MKKVLIISPYFAPSNTADMQRLRMSLPYFATHNWEAEVVTVDEQYSDVTKDELLLKSIPTDIKIHKVAAFSKKWTSKMGLGSLGLRSLFHFKRYVNKLLRNKKYDLIYFSTTEFMVTILGRYWKRKFKVPYVIDMQDPWHSTYYQNKPKNQRPKKYWFSYRMHKYGEPLAMKNVDGLISVSQNYIDTLKERYPAIKNVPEATIPFGAFRDDFEIAKYSLPSQPSIFEENEKQTNIVYIGRAGYDMQQAINLLFAGFKVGLDREFNLFNRIRFFFIGTSYAQRGQGTKTVLPLAEKENLTNYVEEYTDRIGFYETLNYLQKADGLFVPGSDDPQYTASKIYPYILVNKPLLAIFNAKSSAFHILSECNAATLLPLDTTETATETIFNFLRTTALGVNHQPNTNWEAFEKYSAAAMTKKQCELFDQVIRRTIPNGI